MLKVVFLAMVCIGLLGCGGPKEVALKSLAEHPNRYAKEHIKVKGNLQFDHYIMAQAEGYQYTDASVYVLKDGNHRIEVFLRGQDVLESGRRTISGNWVKPPRGNFRLEYQN